MKKHKKRNVVILCSVLLVLGLVAYLALSGNDNGDDFMQGIRDGMREAQNQKQQHIFFVVREGDKMKKHKLTILGGVLLLLVVGALFLSGLLHLDDITHGFEQGFQSEQTK